MKKILDRRVLYLIIVQLSLFGIFSTTAQGNPHQPTVIKTAFIKAFNNQQFTELEQLFNDRAAGQKLVRGLKPRFSKALSQIGPIDKMVLESVSGNTYTYRSFNGLSSLSIIFTLDKKDMLSALSLGPYAYKNAPVLDRNVSKFILPFKGEWFVYWGGKTVKQNYHNGSSAMRGAYDLYVVDENRKSHSGTARRNEDFYAFGKEIIAPVSGTIVFVADGMPDNKWPAMASKRAYGNAVILKTGNNEYVVFAHLKQNSIKVSEGQKVQQGELLALCGNSGTSTEPHLHFQVQNLPDLIAPTGAFVHFERIKVNGKIMTDHIPVKGDRISN